MAEHRSVRELFLEARELEGAAREAFLERACGEDRSLRAEVEKLLETEEQATSRLPDPGEKIVLSSGQMVGHFEIIGKLGAGGMGEVYKARDSTLGREVAIKVLPTDLAGDSNWLGRFAREARAASALNHPNIVTIHEFGEQDSGHCYIVMELVKGRSLRSFLTGDPLPWSQIVDLGTQIGDALARAHEAGIVHRDLKPENIMVTDDGIVKVVDFGLAKLLAPADDEEGNEPTLVKTAEGTILGTPAYMSPEQIRGERIDFRTDQFSFGAVLYEMATGHRPFRASTAVDQIAAILSQESPPIRSVAPDLPLPLVWIIERCLEKKEEERYGSTRDLVKDLRNLRTLDSSSAATPLAPPARAERNGIPVTALVALAAVVTAILLAVWFTRDRSITGSAGEPFAVSVELPAGAAITSPEVMARIDISPDGRSLVISAMRGGVSSLWVRSLDSPRWIELPGTEGGLSPEWSPDGESIAFYAGGKVKRIAVAGGPPVDLCDASYQGKPGWAPDGTILFGSAGSAGSGIFAVSEDGGEPRQITEIGERGDLLHAYPEILPDGEHFIYLASSTSGAGKEVEHTIWLSRLDGSEERRFASIPSMVVFSGPESVIYARESTLLEQEFDPEELRLVGDAHVVGDDLHYFFTTGMGVFTSSQAGNIVYKRSPAPSKLLWRDRAGNSAGEVGGEAAFVSFEISPDGTRVAAAVDDPKMGSGDIWVYDTIRNTSTRLTDWPTDEIAPVWSSDGRTIFCRSDAMGPPSLFSIDAGGGELRLLRRSFTVDAPLDTSPDDATLLFQSVSRATGSDLWTLPLEAPDQAEPLLQTRFWEDDARYAPDGEWIAYESNQTGRIEIYLRALGSGRSVRISPDGGRSPRWSGDGRELFYREPDGSVMAVAADTTESVFGAPQRIFKSDVTGWWWDVASDGERFLFLSSGSDTRTLELVVR